VVFKTRVSEMDIYIDLERICMSISPYIYICAHTRNSRQKWGDTEIAERGRSVPVMRARYRSAGLIPHQRGWTDAG